MGMSLGIIAIKGGVGKTSVSSSLATSLAKGGKKVLLVDANYGAPNLGLHMDIVVPEKTIHDVLSGRAKMKTAIHSKYGVDIIPGSYVANYDINPMKLKDKVSTIKKDYDFVIIDGSPSLNEEILSTMVASDLLFVVSTPDYPTLSCSLRAAHLARKRGRPIGGVILNKIRDPRYELSLKDIERTSALPVVARIPDEKVHVKALCARVPVAVFDPRAKFSREIGKLGDSLTGNTKKTGWWQRVFSKRFRPENINRHVMQEKLYEGTFGEF